MTQRSDSASRNEMYAREKPRNDGDIEQLNHINTRG